jgi:hypothetical protein
MTHLHLSIPVLSAAAVLAMLAVPAPGVAAEPKPFVGPPAPYEFERETTVPAAKARREREEMERYAQYLRDIDRERRVNEPGAQVGGGWRVAIDGIKEPRIVIRRNMD